MSSVRIRFETIGRALTQDEIDFSASYTAPINLRLTVSGLRYDLHLFLAEFPAAEKVRYVHFLGDLAATNRVQAEAYAHAMNRDYPNKGYTAQLNAPGPNITATVDEDVVIVSAQIGTFSHGESRSSFINTIYEYNNSVPSPAKSFTFAKKSEGNCTTEIYTATEAAGGVPPYRLLLGGNQHISLWTGVTDRDFTLQRAATYSGGLYDANNTLIKTVSINPSKNIKSSDFNVNTTPSVGSAQVQVEVGVPRAGTTPLQYALEDNAGSQTPWQTENTFSGISAGAYTLKVRDVYGCEVSTIIQISVLDTPLEQGNQNYINVSEFNSISFYKETKHNIDARKNYTNTASNLDRVKLAKNGGFYFPPERTISTQFRSSFPAHRITLFRQDHSPIALPFFEIQRNIGDTEKVDCMLFPLVEFSLSFTGGSSGIQETTGVYFDGGSQYEPGTTQEKVDPDSPYNGVLPGWAQEGNTVELDGLGVFEILRTDLYDAEREVPYFEIGAVVATARTARIETSWDRHPYNVFRFDFQSGLIPKQGAFVRIEPGIMSGSDFLVDTSRIQRSEPLWALPDASKFLKITWEAEKNIGNMIFLDGIKSEMWVKGRLRPFSDTEAETTDGDDETRSIDQEAFLRMKGVFPVLPVRHWRKLDLIGSIGNRGTVRIEDLTLVRLSPSEQEEIGDSNLSSVSVDFAFNTESTASGTADPVYSLDTGLTVNPDGLAGTGREEITGWQTTGNRLAFPDGTFIKILVDGVGTFIEIL